MSDKTSLGNRMKRYEQVNKKFLIPKIPVMIRIDGKAFSKFTKGMDKPFDEVLTTVMQETMKYLCTNIQSCKFGYTQSDEITLLLSDLDKIESEMWFGGNIQKIVSVSASMSTMAFNKFFRLEVEKLLDENLWNEEEEDREHELYLQRLEVKTDVAMFDSRVFQLSKEEVINNFIWRQQDATKNSILNVGQNNFSFNEMQGLKTNEVQEKLWDEKKINWNDLPTEWKRGSCCYKVLNEYNGRYTWFIDKEMPIITQNRVFIDRWVYGKDTK